MPVLNEQGAEQKPLCCLWYVSLSQVNIFMLSFFLVHVRIPWGILIFVDCCLHVVLKYLNRRNWIFPE